MRKRNKCTPVNSKEQRPFFEIHEEHLNSASSMMAFVFCSGRFFRILFFFIIAITSLWSHGCRGLIFPKNTNKAASRQHQHHNSNLMTNETHHRRWRRRRGGVGGGMMGRHIDKIFNEADSNNDGSVEIDEAYVLILKVFIYVNRQAPVQPPSLEKIKTFFATADTDQNGRLELEEFRRLVLFVYARNSTRILAYKVVKHVVAPLLALQTFANLQIDSQICKTVLVVCYVAFLGNIALCIADFFLDKIPLSPTRPKKKE